MGAAGAGRSLLRETAGTARRPVVRRPGLACVGGPRARRRGRGGPTRAERLLVGVAVALCSAVVVVALGLVADVAADANAGHADTTTAVAP